MSGMDTEDRQRRLAWWAGWLDTEGELDYAPDSRIAERAAERADQMGYRPCPEDAADPRPALPQDDESETFQAMLARGCAALDARMAAIEAARALLRRRPPTPEDFDARGDGLTDDTEAMRAWCEGVMARLLAFHRGMSAAELRRRFLASCDDD